MDIIQNICDWNKDRNNIEYSKHREAGFILEEFYELMNFNSAFETKDEFQEYISNNLESYEQLQEAYEIKENSIEEQADAFADLIVFAVGALYKICENHKEFGSPQLILEKVMNANNKKSNKQNKDGKIIKNSDFVEPTLI